MSVLSRHSLFLRLLFFFSLLLIIAWSCAAWLAFKESRDYINTFYDTQQILFAKTLLSAQWESAEKDLPTTRSLVPGKGKKRLGREDKDSLAFAVFTSQGEIVLTDGIRGADFRYEPRRRGFVNVRVKGEDWRVFWVASQDGARVAAVGQERQYRKSMAMDMLARQMLPWLLLLPVLSLGLGWMLHRELRPLRRMAAELSSRSPEDARPLPVDSAPPEVRPLVEALNSLFVRGQDLRERERAFVAHAAHELRTPLAGLKIQTEVLALCGDDGKARTHILEQLSRGVERSSRLVEQLLTLSRMESQQESLVLEPLSWPSLVQGAVEDMSYAAEGRRMTIRVVEEGQPSLRAGYPTLLGALLTTLLDNAVKYAPEGSSIVVRLTADALSVENSGSSVPEEYMPRLGQRFFRLPGQQGPGSGLGLAIARHVAELHQGMLLLENLYFDASATPSTSCGFAARFFFPPCTHA